jgi:prepilin-type N-terminal cleavage/methylation domain-containing protein
MLNKVRQLKKEAEGSKAAGFTIIEVMIVLAIAGLIMAIVFVAIPQLQKNTRNTTRKDVLNRVKTEIDNYSSNNNGKYPTADNNATTGINGGFKTRYLSNVSYDDPQTGSSMTLNGMTAANISAGGYTSAMARIDYATGVICSGELATTTGASNRNYVVITQLEGGAKYCADNH